MKSQKNIFIFRASKQQYKTLPELMYVGCDVLKEIESPDGIKVCVNSGGVNHTHTSYSVRAFCLNLWAKYTSTQKVVGTGNQSCQQEIGLCSRLLTPSRDDIRSAKRRTFKGLNCRFSLPFYFSERGKIEGGEDLHCLNSPLAHLAGFTLNSL